MELAALDIETLDTTVRSHVFEVAVVRATLDKHMNLKQTSALLFRFDYAEQKRLMRDRSLSTIEFHEKIRTASGLSNALTGISDYQNVDAQTGLSMIAAEVLNAEELWINGLSFDCCILQTLAKDCGFTPPLWFHRRERDVRTIRETNPYVKREVSSYKAAHRAYEDTVWNLQVAAAYHKWMASLPEGFT